MAKWTIEDDMHLALYFEVAGAFNMEMDLGRSQASCKARWKKLKETGAADILRKMQVDSYNRHVEYFSALKDARGLESLISHPGNGLEGDFVIDAGEVVDAYAEERAKRHMLSDCIELGEIPADMTYEKINRLYPDFWDTRKLTPRLTVVK